MPTHHDKHNEFVITARQCSDLRDFGKLWDAGFVTTDNHGLPILLQLPLPMTVEA